MCMSALKRDTCHSIVFEIRPHSLLSSHLEIQSTYLYSERRNHLTLAHSIIALVHFSSEGIALSEIYYYRHRNEYGRG